MCAMEGRQPVGGECATGICSDARCTPTARNLARVKPSKSVDMIRGHANSCSLHGILLFTCALALCMRPVLASRVIC
jgi:hypothetical protein